jgi:hypothetical protein
MPALHAVATTAAMTHPPSFMAGHDSKSRAEPACVGLAIYGAGGYSGQSATTPLLALK